MTFSFTCTRCYEKTTERHWIGRHELCRKCVDKLRKLEGLPLLGRILEAK